MRHNTTQHHYTPESKLESLIDLEGIEEEDIIHVAEKASQPGICINDCCDYIANVEPDTTDGWCESCCTPTVISLQELYLSVI